LKLLRPRLFLPPLTRYFEVRPPFSTSMPPLFSFSSMPFFCPSFPYFTTRYAPSSPFPFPPPKHFSFFFECPHFPGTAACTRVPLNLLYSLRRMTARPPRSTLDRAGRKQSPPRLHPVCCLSCRQPYRIRFSASPPPSHVASDFSLVAQWISKSPHVHFYHGVFCTGTVLSLFDDFSPPTVLPNFTRLTSLVQSVYSELVPSFFLSVPAAMLVVVVIFVKRP